MSSCAAHPCHPARPTHVILRGPPIVILRGPPMSSCAAHLLSCHPARSRRIRARSAPSPARFCDCAQNDGGKGGPTHVILRGPPMSSCAAHPCHPARPRATHVILTEGREAPTYVILRGPPMSSCAAHLCHPARSRRIRARSAPSPARFCDCAQNDGGKGGPHLSCHPARPTYIVILRAVAGSGRGPRHRQRDSATARRMTEGREAPPMSSCAAHLCHPARPTYCHPARSRRIRARSALSPARFCDCAQNDA